MIKWISALSLIALLMAGCASVQQPAGKTELFHRQDGMQTRWASFENPTGGKGRGGMENRGAKGHPCEPFKNGETKVLMDVQGSGVVRRIWITLQMMSPEQTRGIRIDMYWDDAPTPAVSAPFADFFGLMYGRLQPFNNTFFSNPEGRSFICTIPMPFQKAARITLTNESGTDAGLLFYDVNYTLSDKPDPDALYFHAHWRRENPTTLGQDFELLPKVEGAGRFLGVHVAVRPNEHDTNWWGEGEFKAYLDGDDTLPTLVGTGTEDYIGSAWGQGEFQQPYWGAPIVDMDRREIFYYRYHVPDPIVFQKDCRITIHQMGGGGKQSVVDMINAGVEVQPVTLGTPQGTVKLLELPQEVDITAEGIPDGWTNYFRRDDVAAVAFFYLDRPENGLPPLAPLADRIADMPDHYFIPKD